MGSARGAPGSDGRRGRLPGLSQAEVRRNLLVLLGKWGGGNANSSSGRARMGAPLRVCVVGNMRSGGPLLSSPACCVQGSCAAESLGFSVARSPLWLMLY